MSFAWKIMQTAKRNQLLITNTFANGFLLASGDFVVQQIERYCNKSDETSTNKVAFINWRRTAQFFVTGFCFGPVMHGWYHMLDKRFPVATAKNVAIKVFFDQALAAPVCVSYFYTATGLLEGKTLPEAFEELKKKFLATYLVDLVIYPASQTINFFLVPLRFRVVFVSTTTFFYSIFLSFIKTSEGKGKEFIESVDKFFGL